MGGLWSMTKVFRSTKDWGGGAEPPPLNIGGGGGGGAPAPLALPLPTPLYKGV